MVLEVFESYQLSDDCRGKNGRFPKGDAMRSIPVDIAPRYRLDTPKPCDMACPAVSTRSVASAVRRVVVSVLLRTDFVAV